MTGLECIGVFAMVYLVQQLMQLGTTFSQILKEGAIRG